MFENWAIFAEVKAYEKKGPILEATLYI